MRFILGVLWGLLHPRQKAVADTYAYGIYGACAHVRRSDSRNRAFHSWSIRDA
jgi:hypothetical protein